MRMKTKVVPVEQRLIEFQNDKITAALAQDGTVYVPIRPICDLLGVSWSPQRRKINRNPILANLLTSVTVTVTEHGQRGDMLCLPLNYLNGWLFGIHPDRVKPEVREKLLAYQLDCHQVLADAFVHDKITHRPDSDIAEILATDAPSAQSYKMIMAMAQMARQQLVLETRLNSAENNINTNRNDLVLLDTRLQSLEQAQPPISRQVDDAQASQISQAVKAIALELGQRSGRNEFGGVYGELYRRFEITSYKLLPTSKFDEAMSFLTTWHQSITGVDLPF